MGRKSLLSKEEWSMCKKCEIRLTPSDARKHASGCHGSTCSPQTSAKPNVSDNKYGFVRNGILHGFFKERPVHGGLEDVKLPQSIAVEIVLLHPSLLELLKIAIGSFVFVWISRDKYLFQKAWPSSSIAPTDVSMSTETQQLLECMYGDVVHVQRLMDVQQLPAAELVLEAREKKEFHSSDEFVDYFRYVKDERPVITGASLLVKYRGQQCNFKVLAESCSDAKKIDAIANVSFVGTDSQVFDSLSDLSLNKLDYPESPNNTSTPKRKLHNLCNCNSRKPEIERIVLIQSNTQIRLAGHETETTERDLPKSPKRISFEDIGGLTKQIEEIKRLLSPPRGIQPPRGIVLFGAPGTGKTMIARAVANARQQNFISINGPELFSKFYGETEARLRGIFSDAKTRAPCVIFIDELDSLCPNRGGSSTQQEQRVVATLLTLMDNLPTDPDNRVVVLAATNKPDVLDPDMRRAGRLDREIEIGIPTSSDRLEILKKMLKNIRHNLSDEEINEIASKAHGYVGADLRAICSKAGQSVLRRIRPGSRSGEMHNSAGTPDSNVMTYVDMVQAAKETKPSGLREFLIEIPEVRWEDVGGQEELKEKLIEVVEFPLKHPEALKRMGIAPFKGVLMYGPPGCSKTLIAKALATESGLNFIAIKGSELFSKWVGESEGAIRQVFRKARSMAPSIVFFDEIDAVAAKRGVSAGGSNVGDRVLTQLLSEMDGLENLKGVSVIASTNRPDKIDSALLRPGRLDRIVYVCLPDAKTRHDIFAVQFRHMPIAEDVHISSLVERTEGYSGAEIVAVCQVAAIKAMSESMEAQQLFDRHFMHALKVLTPRTSHELIKFYESYHVKESERV